MTIKLKITANLLTVGDIIQAEEGFKGSRQMVEFLAKFVVDENEEPVALEAARAMILALPLRELPGITAQLTEAVKALQEQAVPK